MKFYLYYTMITGQGVMESDSVDQALAAREALRLAGGTVTKIVDAKGLEYSLEDLVKLAARTQN